MHTRCRAFSMFSTSGPAAPACGRHRAVIYRSLTTANVVVGYLAAHSLSYGAPDSDTGRSGQCRSGAGLMPASWRICGSGLGFAIPAIRNTEDQHPPPLPEPLVSQDPGHVEHDDEQRHLEREPEGQHHRHHEAQVLIDLDQVLHAARRQAEQVVHGTVERQVAQLDADAEQGDSRAGEDGAPPPFPRAPGRSRRRGRCPAASPSRPGRGWLTRRCTGRRGGRRDRQGRRASSGQPARGFTGSTGRPERDRGSDPPRTGTWSPGQAGHMQNVIPLSVRKD